MSQWPPRSDRIKHKFSIFKHTFFCCFKLRLQTMFQWQWAAYNKEKILNIPHKPNERKEARCKWVYTVWCHLYEVQKQ